MTRSPLSSPLPSSILTPQCPPILIPKLSDLLLASDEPQSYSSAQDLGFPTKRRSTMLPALSIFQQIGRLPGLTYVDRRIRNVKKQQKCLK